VTCVVDASAVVAALVDDGEAGRWAESVLAAGRLAAPHVLPAEVANVMRRAELAGQLSREAAALASADLLRMSLELFPYALVADRAWSLRSTVSTYDGWYVALAELLDVPLVTLDLRLSRATGPGCTFRLPPHAP
jgi:predicted nucleic acid-binding protein